MFSIFILFLDLPNFACNQAIMVRDDDLWLPLFHLIHISLSIFASILLLIIVLLLRRFDVFHKNLKILLWQTLLCILANVCLQSFRPILQLIQWLDGGMVEMEGKFDEKKCPELNAFPAPFCAFICIAGVLICMERLYATFNFAKYEHEDFEWILLRIFGIMWIFVGLYSLNDFYFDLLPGMASMPYLECRFQQVRINPLKTQWHLLFTLLFHCVFCLVIAVILNVNKEKQEVYVKLHYSSLSHRFQIAENVKSVRLLLKIVPQLGLAAVLLLSHSIWLYNSIATTTLTGQVGKNPLLIRVELDLLIMPMISSTIAYTTIRSSNVFKMKAKLIAGQLWSKIRHPGQLGGADSKKLEELL